MYAVVPVAGFGTRLQPLTQAIPKELLPVGRKVLVHHVIDELVAFGVTDIYFVVSEQKLPFFESFIGRGDQFGIQAHYVVQPAMKGLGDALACVEPYVAHEDAMVVALGDTFFHGGELGGLLTRMRQTTANGSIAVRPVSLDMSSRYGMIYADPNDSRVVHHIVEKPAPHAVPSNLAVCGRYILDGGIFESIHATKTDNHCEVPFSDAINHWIGRGRTMEVVKLDGQERRFDVGNFDTYFEAFVQMAIADEIEGDEIRSFVRGIAS